MSLERTLRTQMPLQFVLTKYNQYFEESGGWNAYLGELVLVIPSGCGGGGYDIRRLDEGPARNGELTVSRPGYKGNGRLKSLPRACISDIIPVSNIPWILYQGLSVMNMRKNYLQQSARDKCIQGDVLNYIWREDPIMKLWTWILELVRGADLNLRNLEYSDLRCNADIDYRCNLLDFRKVIEYGN